MITFYKNVFQIKPPDIARDLTLANKLHKLARSLENDAFVQRNLFALADIDSRNELKTIANNFALNTADDHDELHHERKRRFIGRILRKVSNWAREKARRIAAAARRKARWLAQRAKRLALAAKRKALALAKKLKAKALAFVNKIKNMFGGFKGVIKAFRMGFLNYENKMGISSEFDFLGNNLKESWHQNLGRVWTQHSGRHKKDQG